jgi:ABC-type multidrug transport system ATPase subunit
VAAVEAEGVGKRYDGLHILQDVSFILGEGETIGLLGEPGSGKSTLLRLMCALERPSDGRLVVAGHPVATRPAAVRASVSAVFGSRGIDPQLTVVENLSLRAALRRVPSQHRTGCFVELLRTFELYERKDTLCSRLSPGECQRLALACGLLGAPQLLLLDDAVTGLDPVTRERLWEGIKELRTAHRTTVVLTASAPGAVEGCGRVGILAGGAMVALDDPEALCRLAGPDVVLVRPLDERLAAARIRDRFGLVVEREGDGTLKVTVERGEEALAELLQGFSSQISAVHLRKPTLADAYRKLSQKETKEI